MSILFTADATGQVESGGDWRRWLPALGMVVILHGAVWAGYTRFKHEILPPQPLPVVQVTLAAPLPVEPRIEPPRPMPPKLERRLQPVPEKQVRAPASLPSPAAQPVMDQAAPTAPAPPATTALPAASVTAPPAPEPLLDPPRYRADYLSNPPPAYPLSARRRGIEGTVLVRAEVSAGGECLGAELKKTSGSDALDRAALEAVKKWRFIPAQRGSQAVVAWVEVPITFKLENN